MDTDNIVGLGEFGVGVKGDICNTFKNKDKLKKKIEILQC